MLQVGLVGGRAKGAADTVDYFCTIGIHHQGEDAPPQRSLAPRLQMLHLDVIDLPGHLAQVPEAQQPLLDVEIFVHPTLRARMRCTSSRWLTSTAPR